MEGPQNKKRRLNYLKCDFCRKSKKKCEPVERQWPGQKCNRCVEEGLVCSENRRASDNTAAKSIKETVAEADTVNRVSPAAKDPGTAREAMKAYYDLSLRVTWLQRIKRYMNSFTFFELDHLNQYCLPLLLPGDTKYDGSTEFLGEIRTKIRKEEEAVASEIVMYLTGTRSKHDELPDHLVSSLSRLLGEVGANPGVIDSQTSTTTACDTLSGLVDRYLTIQDRASALDVQEIIVMQQLSRKHPGKDCQHLDHESLQNALIRYCQIHTMCQDYLKQLHPLGADLELPPLHNLLNILRDVSFFHLFNSEGLKGHMRRTDFFERTLLHLALDLGLEGLEKFLPLVLYARYEDIHGRRPLHISCWKGITAISSLLIDLAASGTVNSQNRRGRTPLHIASAKGRPALLSELLEKGGAEVDIRDKLGHTALYYAIACGQISSIAILQGKCSAWMGWSTFFLPAVRSRNIAVVNMIIRNLDAPIPEYMVTKALEIAISDGNEGAVDLLMSLGRDIEKECYGEDDNTLLRYAVKANKPKIVALLIHRYGAQVNSYSHWCFTPLTLACYRGLMDVVTVLLECGHADPDQRDIDGRSALEVAAEESEVQIMSILVKYGAEVDGRDHERRTPLFMAVRSGALASVKFLLDAGANVLARDIEGRSVVDICKEPLFQYHHQHEEIMDTLKRHGAKDEDDTSGESDISEAYIRNLRG